MKSKGGISLQYTLFGSSHSECIGIEIENIKQGFKIDFDCIHDWLCKRQGGKPYNTKRQEAVEYVIESGVDESSITTGEVIRVVFNNSEQRKKDYDKLKNQPRPGHADFVAMKKYGEFNSGGGHFSGRMTAPIVFLGQLCYQLIKSEYADFDISTVVRCFQNQKTQSYYELRSEAVKNISEVNKSSVTKLRDTVHSKLSARDAVDIDDACEKLISDKTSAGGLMESVVVNPPTLIGEPFFAGVESVISSLLYAIPSVKGVSFGYGDNFINSKGHEVKDEIIYFDERTMYTLFNYNGGINGGITNGEDIVINCVLKPVSSIMQVQNTYNEATGSVECLEIGGRHDVTVVNRVIPVIDSMICIAIYELMQKNIESK